MKGTVKWFDAKKGYGFILAEGVDADIFVHFAEIQSAEGEFKTLKMNEQVEFELVEAEVSNTKKPQAKNVQRSLKSSPRPTK